MTGDLAVIKEQVHGDIQIVAASMVGGAANREAADRLRRLHDTLAALVERLERERKARKAVERVNADEVLARRSNLNAQIESLKVERDDALERLEQAEGALRRIANANQAFMDSRQFHEFLINQARVYFDEKETA